MAIWVPGGHRAPLPAPSPWMALLSPGYGESCPRGTVGSEGPGPGSINNTESSHLSRDGTAPGTGQSKDKPPDSQAHFREEKADVREAKHLVCPGYFL